MPEAFTAGLARLMPISTGALRFRAKDLDSIVSCPALARWLMWRGFYRLALASVGRRMVATREVHFGVEKALGNLPQ